MIAASRWHGLWGFVVTIAAAILMFAGAETVLSERAPPAAGGKTINPKAFIIYVVATFLVCIVVKMIAVEVLKWTRSKKGGRPGKAHHISGPHEPSLMLYDFADRRRKAFFAYVQKMMNEPEFASGGSHEITQHMLGEKTIGERRPFKERWCTGDDSAYFVPQRIFAAIVVSGLAQTWIFINSFTSFDSLVALLRNAANTALQTSFKGITAMTDLYERTTGKELYDQDQDQIQSIRKNAYFLYDEFNQSALELRTAIILAFTCSVLIFVVSWVLTLRAFRSQVMLARRGLLTWRQVDPAAQKLWYKTRVGDA
jgi:uncharacterized membrane protein